MKRLSMLLIPCIAISANAATFNAQGKTINSNDAKNPGIVKFEKNTAVKAKIKTNKPAALAKGEIPAITNVVHVTPYDGRFSTNDNSYTLRKNRSDMGVTTKEQYLEKVNGWEQNDAAREHGPFLLLGLGSNSHSGNGDGYKYRAEQNKCEITSSSYNYNAFFNHVYADILQRQKFNCNGSNSGTCGNEINIYNVTVPEKGPVTFNGSSCVDPGEGYNKSFLNYSYRIQHYNIEQFFATASPNATLYSVSDEKARGNGVYMTSAGFSGKGGFPWHFFDTVEGTESAPHIINIVSSSKKDVSSYNDEAAAIDDHIYATRAIEFAAYTEDGKITGPGTSLNAISVSPASADGYILKRDVVKNARFHPTAQGAGFNKPEIYSLSYAYNSYNDFSRKVKHDNNEYDILGITDSWGASTTASAMAANLLSKYPFYKWHPEVVKALMATANNRAKLTKLNYDNINDITSSNILSNSSTINYNLTLFEEMTRNNVSRYWYGNNNDFFYPNTMSFTENVDRGGKYNIAIAWLVSGEYARRNKHLSSKYTFRIYDDATGRKLTESSETNQSTLRYKAIDIPSNVSKIRIEIERTQNTGDRVILGFNMHKVTQ